MQKTTRIFIIIGAALAVIIIGVLLHFFLGRSAPAGLASFEVKSVDITEKVNLTGQVKASQGVDLAFESQGKIVANYVKVGDKIYTGEPLLAIDDSVLQSQLGQAQAQLDVLNIDTVKSRLDATLQSLYANSLNASQKSTSVAKDVLLTISDIQSAHFMGQAQLNTALQDKKAQAVDSLLGQSGAGLWASQSIAQLNGGAYGLVQSAINNPDYVSNTDTIDAALSATQSALQDVSNLVNAVPIDPALTATERASISLAKTNINLEIIATSANIQAISTQKINSSATLATTNAQIEAAKANINTIETQISKTTLKALFNGQVDKDNAIVGQIVSPNVPVITISNNSLEIDTNIPEIDLQKVKGSEGHPGKADITLDAFGLSKVFKATVISIDMAPTNVSGISVYGAKLKFDSQNDSILPGMTANITFTE